MILCHVVKVLALFKLSYISHSQVSLVVNVSKFDVPAIYDAFTLAAYLSN